MRSRCAGLILIAAVLAGCGPDAEDPMIPLPSPLIDLSAPPNDGMRPFGAESRARATRLAVAAHAALERRGYGEIAWSRRVVAPGDLPAVRRALARSAAAAGYRADSGLAARPASEAASWSDAYVTSDAALVVNGSERMGPGEDVLVVNVLRARR